MPGKKKKRQITKDMLKQKSFYKKAKVANWTRKGDDRLKATKKSTDMSLGFSIDALKGKKPLVLTTIWAPSEILYALDLLPICVDSSVAGLASYQLSDDYLAAAEKRFHSPETCSIVRCGVGAVNEKLFPRPAAVIATSHLCDGGAKSMEHAARIYGCEYFLIDIPQERGSEAVDYVASQLEEMAGRLSGMSGNNLSRERLSEAIRISNQTREYALWVNKLRRTVPSPIRGSEALGNLFLVGVAFGSQTGLRIYQTMAREIERRKAKKYTPLGEEKHRLLWLHLKPFFRNGFFHYMELDKKMAIAFEEINHIYWPELDPLEPYRSVATRLLSNSINLPLEKSIETYLKIIDDYKIEGAIQLTHWGCRWNYGRTKILKEIFQEKGIPLLSLDCDAASSRSFNESQLRGRLDAFIDMLG